MPTEAITALGTLVVAVVAGVISYAAGRGMKTHEWRLALVKEEIATRKALYIGFLTEAQRLLVQSLEMKTNTVADLNDLNAKYAEISLVGAKPVVEAAKLVVDAVLSAHTAGDSDKNNDFFGKKERLINAVRSELDSYREP